MLKIGWHGAAGVLVSVLAGTLSAAEPAAFKRTDIKSLRYDEDYRFLADKALETDLWDPIKYIPLKGGQYGYATIGGEARLMGEGYRHEFFSTAPDANNVYLLQRYLLHLDYHPTDSVRFFSQLQSAFEAGKQGDGDVNILDLHQLFVDFHLDASAASDVTVRLGRQELSYGSERLIGVREGTNNRRAFDGAKIIYTSEEFRVDAFLTSPVEWDQGAFDDQNVEDAWLWGAYGTSPLAGHPAAKLDFYYLGLHKPNATFSQGKGDEERHTLGSRLSGKAGAWDFNHEAIYQFGDFDGGDIRAWSVATDHGYTVPHLWARPRVGLKAAIASGDRDAHDTKLETFNPLYPRGSYFTEASLLGPQNFMDLRPSLTLQPTKDVSLEIGADFYWRQSLDDGIYRPSGSVIYEGDSGLARFVGTDFSIAAGWQATRHFSLGAAYTHFFAGPFVQRSGGTDVNYGALWITYRF